MNFFWLTTHFLPSCCAKLAKTADKTVPPVLLCHHYCATSILCHECCATTAVPPLLCHHCCATTAVPRMLCHHNCATQHPFLNKLLCKLAKSADKIDWRLGVQR